MKTIQIFTTLLLVFFYTNCMTAQSEERSCHHGFGGASFVNTSLAGDWAFEAGGLGAGFITDKLYLGGGGFGLTQKKSGYEYDMGYGGLMLGYLWGDDKKTSLNFYVLGGYGGITEDSREHVKQEDDFWVVRPAIEVDFRITEWMAIGVGGGYRWAMGSNISSLTDKDLSASFGSITLRFGMVSR